MIFIRDMIWNKKLFDFNACWLRGGIGLCWFLGFSIDILLLGHKLIMNIMNALGHVDFLRKYLWFMVTSRINFWELDVRNNDLRICNDLGIRKCINWDFKFWWKIRLIMRIDFWVNKFKFIEVMLWETRRRKFRMIKTYGLILGFSKLRTN